MLASARAAPRSEPKIRSGEIRTRLLFHGHLAAMASADGKIFAWRSALM
jgi:hypothetical protein